MLFWLLVPIILFYWILESVFIPLYISIFYRAFVIYFFMRVKCMFIRCLFSYFLIFCKLYVLILWNIFFLCNFIIGNDIESFLDVIAG